MELPTTFRVITEGRELDSNELPMQRAARENVSILNYEETIIRADGGRVFVTALGHTPALYDDPRYLEHLYGGLWWAATGKGIDTLLDVAFDMREALRVSEKSPVLLDRFLDDAIEVDVDCVSDGKEVLIETFQDIPGGQPVQRFAVQRGPRDRGHGRADGRRTAGQREVDQVHADLQELRRG